MFFGSVGVVVETVRGAGTAVTTGKMEVGPRGACVKGADVVAMSVVDMGIVAVTW